MVFVIDADELSRPCSQVVVLLSDRWTEQVDYNNFSMTPRRPLPTLDCLITVLKLIA
jgi:hypothetical protein